jgi:hypothetical protein
MMPRAGRLAADLVYAEAQFLVMRAALRAITDG